MTRAEQRLADLERQLAELRRDFNANALILEAAFAAGHAAGREAAAGQRPAVQRPRNLSVVGGGGS